MVEPFGESECASWQDESWENKISVVSQWEEKKKKGVGAGKKLPPLHSHKACKHKRGVQVTAKLLNCFAFIIVGGGEG